MRAVQLQPQLASSSTLQSISPTHVIAKRFNVAIDENDVFQLSWQRGKILFGEVAAIGLRHR